MNMQQILMECLLGWNHLIFIFGSSCFTCVFFGEQFSNNLQAKDITIQESTHGSALLISHLNNSLKTEYKVQYIL